jgi:hypothetical protein
VSPSAEFVSPRHQAATSLRSGSLLLVRSGQVSNCKPGVKATETGHNQPRHHGRDERHPTDPLHPSRMWRVPRRRSSSTQPIGLALCARSTRPLRRGRLRGPCRPCDGPGLKVRMPKGDRERRTVRIGRCLPDWRAGQGRAKPARSSALTDPERRPGATAWLSSTAPGEIRYYARSTLSSNYHREELTGTVASLQACPVNHRAAVHRVVCSKGDWRTSCSVADPLRLVRRWHAAPTSFTSSRW